MLRNTGFPVDQLWHGGLLGEMEDEEDMEDCPQEQIMTVRQTTPALSEGGLFDEDLVDIGSNATVRPTLRAVLWLSELIATTALHKDKVTRKGPQCDQIATMGHA